MLASQPAFVGGQISLHVEEWEKLTSDPFILMCVSNYQIEFNSEPVSGWRQTLPVYQFSLAEQIAIDEEVRSLLSKNVIERSQPETGNYFTNISPAQEGIRQVSRDFQSERVK